MRYQHLDALHDTIGLVILGGALIGLAAAVFTHLLGREMNGSGMIASLLGGPEGIAATSIAFLGGLLIAPSIFIAFGFVPQMPTEVSWPFLVTGGLLIGLGARFGGASLGASIAGLARRPGHTIKMGVAIFAGAALALCFKTALANAGFP